jgi:hypothetical protein
VVRWVGWVGWGGWVRWGEWVRWVRWVRWGGWVRLRRGVGRAGDTGAKDVTPRRSLVLLLLFAALATLHTWPLARDPAHLTRLDNDDTAFNTWVIAWDAHQLARDPLHLFEAPIFYPARHALAFSEHMIVQGAMGAPLQWAGVSPVLVYNLLVWVGFTLSGFAAALLMLAWTDSMAAAVVTGCLYAFNAHLLTRFSHLQALHLEFFPVVLYAFDRVLRGAGRATTFVLLAVAFVLQALCSNYTLALITVALVAAFVVRPEPWAFERRLWLPLLATGCAVMLLLAPFLWPYYLVRGEQGLVRSIEEVHFYSAGLLDYFVTAGRLHFTWWSHWIFEGRNALFPGITASALAAAAVATGLAWRDRRARMALAFGLAGFALSFGDALPGYAWLHDHVALLQGIRAAARWGLLPLLAIALLAGFMVARLESRWRWHAVWPATVVALAGLVTIEALRAPLALVRFTAIPAVHARLANEPVNALVVYPLFGGSQFNRNARYLLDQTRHWKPMLNAYSSFAPPVFYELASRLRSFPSADAMRELRANGFTHVELHRAALEREIGKAAVDGLRARDDLEFVVEQDDVIIYRVKGTPVGNH